MVKDGLIRRSVSASDGRVAIFQLTRRGQRIFAEMAEINRAWVAEAFSPLTPGQISTLRNLLGALNRPARQSEEEAA